MLSLKKDHYYGRDFWQEGRPKEKRIEYPINDRILKKSENLLNIRFPQSFIDLMKIQNGGGLNYPYFILPAEETESIPYEERVKLSYILPLHFENDDLSILSSDELLKEVDLPTGFIVLWTDFHYWVVLDYRKTKDNPSVMFIAEDFSALDSETKEWEYIKIADSFDEFLEKIFR
ncbi:SMI1/KNR4 family protein [Peribacillus psychrosaccharolyticus]|uniref:SMI1/KNR4 family protein n=1 Tax=Peribacillus psychrosaccharolyticus TaxID=1407 RepID=UPI002DB6F5C5|nr:SMI1/KNR4 family protein [Peribacillus psychrosaccharolyticus]MEC2055943.1 SMI1/KNR4 family protein [Peribacillus psychrosaccharolyticus]MED3743118.1 SMI1/KNR4 family protein [Peribacillus psychrosaccharolyticus]